MAVSWFNILLPYAVRQEELFRLISAWVPISQDLKGTLTGFRMAVRSREVDREWLRVDLEISRIRQSDLLECFNQDNLAVIVLDQDDIGSYGSVRVLDRTDNKTHKYMWYNGYARCHMREFNF